MLTTVEAAEIYFETRLGASKWTAADAATKTAALTTAENDLSLYYTLDESDARHLKAIYEQALFRLIDEGVDRRTGLQAQGVQSAGMVQESYMGRAGQVPICGYARQILGSPDAIAFGGQLTRDDDED